MARVVFAGSLALMMAVLVTSRPATAQVITPAIGGVEVNPEGILNAPSTALVREAAERIRQAVDKAPESLTKPTDSRTVSLRGIEQELANALREQRDVPDEVLFLAGLTKVQHIIVDPKSHDILLAGPAEPWEVNPAGIVVGVDSRQPILRLDDLLVTLRNVERARTEGITCSIDPTAEGRQRMQQLLSRQKQFTPGITKAIEQALGMQQITITGVPADSHYARVLAAADFRMKRFAMMLEPAPVEGMPSFLELIRARQGGLNNMMPRWWIAGSYDPVAKSEDGLTWEIRGRGVQVLTEDEIISRSGEVSGTGQVNPVAQQWAATMTSRYDELSRVDAVFGQLQNIMDLSLVAALIAREDLCGAAGCDLALLQDVGAEWKTESWPAPQWVASQSSFIKVKREYVITASGGVQVDSWGWASNTEVVPDLKQRVSSRVGGENVRSGWTW